VDEEVTVERYRTMSIRLPQDLADLLEAIARADDKSMAEEVREAVAAHVRKRAKDTRLRERLEDQAVRYRRVVERLREA
jgi:predicted DNA-binding protein